MKAKHVTERVYMVSFPENADWAEWWSIAGLFSTREKAQRFIKEHPIRLKRGRLRFRSKYRTEYFPIAEIEIDRAPIVHELEVVHEKSFYGMHDYDLTEYFYKKGRQVKRY